MEEFGGAWLATLSHQGNSAANVPCKGPLINLLLQVASERMQGKGVKVLFFARGRELAGVSEVTVHLGDAPDTVELLKYLLAKFPNLCEIIASTVLSLNQEYLQPNETLPLKNGDEVAVIPPVSGG